MDGRRLVELRLGRAELARIGAPLAFLAAVTVAVLLVRAGLDGGAGAPAQPERRATPARTATRQAPARPAETAPAPAPGKQRPPRRGAPAAAKYATVEAGDTFYVIATREGTTVAELERLNPGVSSNALTIGQRLRVG